MKLLSPSQLRDSTNSQTEREILRAQEASKVADSMRKKLANSEADFNLMLAGQRSRWATEEKEHIERVAEMVSEVKVLTLQRENALKPIDALKTEAEEKMKEAITFSKSVQAREEEVEELKEHLENKLDEVGEREISIVKEEQNIFLQKQGLEMQKVSIGKGSIDLSQKMQEFSSFKSQEEKIINDAKKALFLKERSLLAKEASLKRTEEDLETLAKQLEDQRQTLERAFQREHIPLETSK